MSGGAKYRPTISTSFASKFGSFDSLKVRSRCGFNPCARQIFWTLLTAMPTAFAMARALQCVASVGLCGGVEKSAT